MNALKTLARTALIGAGAALAVTAQATDAGRGPGVVASAAAAELTDGEIKKVDKGSQKLTIKHGDIKNLDMPGMTMVFQVRDPAMVDQVKVGDRIRFKVEKGSAGGFVVTEIQQARK